MISRYDATAARIAPPPQETEAKPVISDQETEFLKQVETALADALVSRDGEPASRSDTLMTASRHLCIGGGGKRIRPLMVRYFSAAAGATRGVVNVAVAAELVHSASLLHDDVVDAGMFRRGRPTVNALWGNIVAVMAGDLLLTVALEQLADLDRQITYDAVATVKEMTYATIDEVEARGEVQLPVERYRRIAEGKTGALFGFCGRAAATLAGKKEIASRFDAFGRHLGVAFQIADDLKDLRGSEPGKPQFADIKSRTPALPLILAAASDEPLRRRMKDLWAFGTAPDEKVKELGAAVLASAAPREALSMMQKEIALGLEALGSYGESDGGRELVGWAHKLAEAFGA
jgi:geranylgeranyl pyrophosphate synthase